MLTKETLEVFVKVIKSRIVKENPVFTEDEQLLSFVNITLKDLGVQFDDGDLPAIAEKVRESLEVGEESENIINDELIEEGTAEEHLDNAIDELIDKIETIRETLRDDVLGMLEDSISTTNKNIEDGVFTDDNPKVNLFNASIYILDQIDKAVEEYDEIFKRQ